MKKNGRNFWTGSPIWFLLTNLKSAYQNLYNDMYNTSKFDKKNFCWKSRIFQGIYLKKMSIFYEIFFCRISKYYTCYYIDFDTLISNSSIKIISDHPFKSYDHFSSKFWKNQNFERPYLENGLRYRPAVWKFQLFTSFSIWKTYFYRNKNHKNFRWFFIHQTFYLS